MMNFLQLLVGFILIASSSLLSPADQILVKASPELAKCNFENSTCPQWWNSSSIPKPFRFQMNNPLNDKSSVPYDHTTKSRFGRFIYIRHQESDPILQKQGLIQNYQTIPADVQAKNACLSFWFYMTTTSFTAQLNVTASGRRNVVSRSGSFGGRWQFQQVNITARDTINVSITAVITSGVIAIDDLFLVLGSCPSPNNNVTFYCQFERNNFCEFLGVSWQNDAETRNAMAPVDPWWRVILAKNASIPNTVDHTRNSGYGHFYALDYGAGDFTSNPILSSTKTFPVVQQACVTFYYFIRKQTPDSYLKIKYNVGASPFDPSPTMFEAYGQQGPSWIGHRIQVYPDQPWGITIEGMGLAKGIIGIDDLKIDLYKECPLFARCDFESREVSDCLWQTIAYKVAQPNLTDFLSPQLPWRKQSARFGFGSYPKTDATTGTSNGNYMLVTEAAFGKSNSNYALYESPRFNATAVKASKGGCLSFSYVIPNNKSGFLKVHQMEENLPFGDPQVLQFYGSTNNKWQRVYITVNLVYDQSRTLWFYLQGFPSLFKQSSQGYGRNFVALDDIAFDYHPCPIDSNFTCANQQKKISSTQVCDFYQDCYDGSDELKCGNCTFETDTCGYGLNTTGSPFVWQRKSGMGIMNGAKQSNWFVYVLGNNDALNVKNKADLKTPKIARSFPGCQLSFFYSFTGRIKFKVILLWKDQEEVELWDRSYYKNFTSDFSIWQEVKINLGRIRVPFRIIFRSIFDELKGYTDEYNAVDEISFINCQPPPTASSCNKDQQKFACRTTKVCINASQVCDFQDDCGDGTDEDDCDAFKNRNDFENGLGMLNQTNWTWTSYFVNSVQGPTRDHTIGLKSGNFIYLGAQNLSITDPNQFPVKKAVWYSPYFKSSSNQSPCVLRFYYQMEGQGSVSLDISVRLRNGNTKPLKRLYGSKKTHSFTRIALPYIGINTDFQFVVTGSVQNIPSAAVYTYIAIDDISYSQECFGQKPPNTVRPPVTSVRPPTDSPPDEEETKKPPVHHEPSSKLGLIFSAVLVPVFVLTIGGIFIYWHYQKRHQVHKEPGIMMQANPIYNPDSLQGGAVLNNDKLRH